MAHYNSSQKNPPWVRSNVQQQPLLAQQMTVQSVALSQPALTTTHLAAQNQIGQVQITPAIQGQVQLPLTQAHLLLNQQLTPAFGQVQINQAQLANIATSQHQATTHQTYFTPSISLQQNVGIPQGTIQIQPSSLVIPTTMSTSIAPPGLAMPTSLATMHSTPTYTLNRMTMTAAPPPLPQQPQVKQRVFSGTVNKIHENFGIIDEDVIFQPSSVKGSMPQAGDRVLVEATYSGSLPFKWNATRVQVIAPPPQQQPQKLLSSTTFNSNSDKQSNRDWNLRGRSTTGNDYRDSDRSNPKAREPRTRERRASRSNSRSPSRKRSRSPQGSPRRRSRVVPRYSVQIPKVSLDCREANLMELRRRYNHMYVPSDFLSSIYWWVSSFPTSRPLPIDKPVSFHIFDKEVEPPQENTAIYEPADADYQYSAKVMLLSLPSTEDFHRKCCLDEEEFVHPARLIRFLVGHRGKNETMAIGGPWSPSLDGSNPQSDPQVLIRTAIRTCKALTGIDLSACTQWYRVAEIRYHRVSSSMKSRIESVLLFVPDVWSCVPTASQWENIIQSYMQPTSEQAEADPETKAEEEVVEETESVELQKEATHYSKLQPKNLNFGELRSELEIRNLNSKGLRTQLIPRLTIALKAEAAEEERRKKEEATAAAAATEEEPLSSREESLAEEAESRRMDFAAMPQILVHPSTTAKSGKFSCSLVSLSVLLDYRPEDTKEHTFEVSLFSELFNEMLMRDFGMHVYRSVSNESNKKERRDKKEDEDSDKKKKKDKKSSFSPLLLAYCYFDLSHCNYIASKDLEDLFLTLGLQLSRAQVRKLLQKVVTEDSLRYRKLVERTVSSSKDEEETEISTPFEFKNALEDGSSGKEAIGSENSNNSNLVAFNGCYVNLEQLLLRLEQSEASRRESEQQFKIAQSQLGECRTELSKANETITTLCQQLESEKMQSESANESLNHLRDCFNQYVDGVNKIQDISRNLLLTRVTESGGEIPLKEEPMADHSADSSEPEYLDKIDH